MLVFIGIQLLHCCKNGLTVIKEYGSNGKGWLRITSIMLNFATNQVSDSKDTGYGYFRVGFYRVWIRFRVCDSLVLDCYNDVKLRCHTPGLQISHTLLSNNYC